VRDLVVALGAAPGSRARLLADGRPVGLDVELADAGIVDGATIQSATSERGGPPASAPPLELAVVGGLDAGRRYALASERTVVGRDIDDGVALRHASVSREHAAFTVHASGAVTATDLGSRNGTWRRGQALRGDVAVDPHDVLRLGAVQVVARSARREDRARRATTLAGLAAVVPFNRPPRPAPPGARAPLDVPEPPKPAAARGPFSIVAVLAPLLMAAVMVKVLGNPAFALFALLSPVMLLGSAVEQRRQRKRSTRREAGRYASDLARFASTFDAAIADELDHRRRALPDLAEVARRATLPSVQLWQRRTRHDDWLQLRAGIGDIVWRPPLTERSGARPTELDALLVDRSVLVDAPVDVDLSAGGIVGLVGGRDASLAVARALVVQAAVHHGPADLTIAVLVAAEAHAAWDWAKWLRWPTAGGGPRRCVSDRRGRARARRRLCGAHRAGRHR
jgi:S-DNA-T family DNA segregation ATPase FtsK/SpoIIIE